MTNLQSKWTSETTLRLTTVTAIQHGLDLLGIGWTPLPWVEGSAVGDGLYAWVDGQGTASPHDKGVLYFGESKSEKRLVDEAGWATVEYVHGHGRAAVRRAAKPLWGAVTLESSDLEWVRESRPTEIEKGTLAIDWLLHHHSSLRDKAERIAVRLSLHLGDTVAPVNSQHASAWEKEGPAEFLAYAVALEMGADDPEYHSPL